MDELRRSNSGEAGLTLVLGFHLHQPAGNFGFVFERATRRCYRPLLELIAAHPGVELTLHVSGPLLEWLADNDGELLDLIRGEIERGRLEILGSGLGEPVLTMLPPRDLERQIVSMSDRCRELLGERPRGAWLTERVWEPGLPAALAPLEVEYTFVDDNHFRAAGFERESARGYHVASRHGRALAVFPISERLRYLIPFRPLDEVLDELERMAEAGARRGGEVICCLDDGEKLGLWPGTHEWVFERGWLEGFLSALERRADRIATALPGEIFDSFPPEGRVALPTSSYGEMCTWALPIAAAERRRDLARWLDEPGRDLLAGGFWDQFAVKYEEAARLRGRMLMTSERLARIEDDTVLRRAHVERARELLHLAQCNDPYWHGLFGGLYLPFLRAAAYARLIEADLELDRVEPNFGVLHFDLDGCGDEEIVVRTPRQTAALRLADGGCLYLLEDHDLRLEMVDVLTRRREPYHERVAAAARRDGEPDGGPLSIHELETVKEDDLESRLLYDRHSRLGGRLRAFPARPSAEQLRTGTIEEMGDFAAARFDLVAVDESEASISVTLRGRDCDLGALRAEVEKRFTFPRGAAGFELSVGLSLRGGAGPPENAHLCAELPLTLDAIDELRRIELEGCAPIPFTSQIDAPGARRIRICDRARGRAWTLSSSLPCSASVYPIETVSASEDGFERIFQGSSLQMSAPLAALAGGEPWVLSLGTH
ncbi:MAG: alpha-amylase/4-alpha-glucanotransferase domain-containing protein [Polyangia bacterium]